VARRLPADVLATSLGEVGCLLVPDPAGPGRTAGLEAAAEACGPVALGSDGTTAELAESWALARAALRAALAGALPAEGLLTAENHLGDLLIFEGSALARHMAELRLSGLDDLTEKAGRRMRETALAYVRHYGNAVAIADALGIHPQTARYRVTRLRQLLGEGLDDPDGRFEIEAALRAQALRGI
jgi:DNA-binding PucR family transcriptional regulator